MRVWCAALGLVVLIAPPGHAATEDGLAMLSRPLADWEALAETTPLGSFDNALATGLVWQARGRHDLAVLAFRAAIALRPDAVAPRQALVASLLAQGAGRLAETELRELALTDPQPVRRSRYRALEAEVAAARPVGARLRFAIVPSSNANRATGNTLAPLPGGGQAQIIDTAAPATSAVLGVDVWRRWRLDHGAVLEFGVGVGGQVYDGSTPDRLDVLLSALWGKSGADGRRWDVGIEAARQVYQGTGEDDAQTLRLRYVAQRPGRDARVWEHDLSLSRTTYDAPVSRAQDVTVARVGLGASRPWGDAGAVFARMALSRGMARDDRFSFAAVGGEVGVSHVWSGGLRGQVTLGWEWKPFDAAFGPGFGYDEARVDRTRLVSLSISHAQLVLWGQSPALTCRVSKTASNIVFYDAVDVTECSLGLVRRF